jgi:hypothetical protein
MNRTPDVELVLRDYFADDSSSAPDHVLDVIEERIMRQPQQRAWRISWRDSHVNSYLKPLLAVAAIVVVAVAGFAILRPSGAGVGGAPATETPTLSPAPSSLGATPSPTGAFGGTVHWGDTGAPVTTEVDAVASGATVTGTAVSTFLGGTHTVRLGCVTRDGDTWALGGTVEQSTLPGEPVGAWSAVIVKDNSPQRIAVWLSGDAPAGSDCPGFLASHDFATLGPEEFAPVGSGALVPPPDLAP